MSAPDPKLNKTKTATPAPVHKPTTFADTNALLQEAIRQLKPAVRSEIILRCDDLARLQISEDALQQAITQLLQMILEEKGESKLFLHITCSKDKERGSRPHSLSRFLIRFHTNLTPHASWMLEAERRTNSIASLLLPFDGSLQVNQLKNSGCVFIIALPGK